MEILTTACKKRGVKIAKVEVKEDKFKVSTEEGVYYFKTKAQANQFLVDGFYYSDIPE